MLARPTMSCSIFRALFKQEPFDKTEVMVLDMVKGAVRFVHEDPKKLNVAIDWLSMKISPTSLLTLSESSKFSLT